VLDDSYNASPDSMFAALDLLASLPGRHVAILGEMLELGDAAEAEHRRVGAHAANTADLLLAVGPMAGEYARGAGSSWDWYGDRETMLETVGGQIRPGDVILIKGSRGAAMDEFLPVLEEAAQRMKAPVA